jgi:hypothetical protein
VTGACLDGELPGDLVLERYAQLDARFVHQLSRADVEPFQPLFEWHPSEATGLLCAAATGTRGTAEIRDRGFPVVLSDRSADVHALPVRTVIEVNRLAQQLVDTRSLDDAEDALRAAGRDSEIDYERQKARSRDRTSPDELAEESSPTVLLDRLAAIRSDAARRNIDFVILRGLAERLGFSGAQLGDLRQQLRSRPSGEYVSPLWNVRPQS